MWCGFLDHVEDDIADGDVIVVDADVDHRRAAGLALQLSSRRGSRRSGRSGRAEEQRLGDTETGPEAELTVQSGVFDVGRLIVVVVGSASRRRRTGTRHVRRRRGARSCRPVSSRWERWCGSADPRRRDRRRDREDVPLSSPRGKERQRVPFGGRSGGDHRSSPWYARRWRELQPSGVPFLAFDQRGGGEVLDVGLPASAVAGDVRWGCSCRRRGGVDPRRG